MSSSPQKGFARRTGVALMGVALLSSLMLSACASATKTSDSVSNPVSSSSASPSAAPRNLTRFKSDSFDFTKQTTVNVKYNDNNILLPSGVVFRKVADKKLTVSYTPYEDKDKAWEYTPDIENLDADNSHVTLMRWKNVSYIVVDGNAKITTPASGLQAAKTATTGYVIILDANSGKTVNTIKGESHEDNSDQNFFLDSSQTTYDATSANNMVPTAFMTGLVYTNINGQKKLVDPLNGNTLAQRTETNILGGVSNGEKGFYNLRTDYPNFTINSTSLKATFGEFILVFDVEPASGNTASQTTVSLLNTSTKAVIGSTKCATGTAQSTNKVATTYSSDFRYVNFLGQYVFDTQTGKAFCSQPAGQANARKFFVTSVDAKGDMYGAADNEYLKVNLADNTKIETVAKDFGNSKELPIIITDKGSAVLYSDTSKDTLVVVPAK